MLLAAARTICLAVTVASSSPIAAAPPKPEPPAKPFDPKHPTWWYDNVNPEGTPFDGWNPPDGVQIHLWMRGHDPSNKGEELRLGAFDADGNFVPVYGDGLRAYRFVSGPGPGHVTNAGGGNKYIEVYEHRSGTLIPGVNGSAKGEAKFVPEIGGTIVTLASRTAPNTLDHRIHNGYGPGMPDFWTQERSKQYPQGLPQVPPPPKAGMPAGYELVPFGKAYPNDFTEGKAWFVRVIADMAEFGRLDADGEFIPDYGLPVLWKAQAPPDATLRDGATWHYCYTLPLNKAKSEAVYEFRSGRLIQGTLYDTGNFAPTVGSKVLDFKDYQPNTSRRIYNLPGVLRPLKAK